MWLGRPHGQARTSKSRGAELCRGHRGPCERMSCSTCSPGRWRPRENTENTPGISDRRGLKKGFLGCIPGTEGANPAVPVRTPPGAPKCSKSHGPRRLGVFLKPPPRCPRNQSASIQGPKPGLPNLTRQPRGAETQLMGFEAKLTFLFSPVIPQVG